MTVNRKRILWISVSVVIAAATFIAGIVAGPAIMRHTTGSQQLRADAEQSTASASGDKSRSGETAKEKDGGQLWTCAMHPNIILKKPGKCPICGMTLIPLKKDKAASGLRVLTMSEDAKKLAEIESVPVERKYVNKALRMVGELVYDERRISTISAWIPGRIDRLYIDYAGIRVEKGDHLAELYSPALLTAQQELLQSLKRVKTSPEESGEYLRKGNLAAIESARRKLQLWGLTPAQIQEIETRGTPSDHMTIFATQSGIVINKHVNEGDYVKTGEPLFTVGDPTKLWAMLDAYETDLPWIRYAQAVAITTQALPGETFSGNISFIPPDMNQITRTAPIRVNVDNADLRLKPGMFVSGVIYSKLTADGTAYHPSMKGKWICPMHPEIVRDKPGRCPICGMPLKSAKSLGYITTTVAEKPPLVIPVTAPLITGKRAVVYLDIRNASKPTYEGRIVTLGSRAGDYYIVRSGLKEGDWVVVNGNFKIDSALQIRAKPSMMNPTGGGPMPGGHAGMKMGGASATSTENHNADSADDDTMDDTMDNTGADAGNASPDSTTVSAETTQPDPTPHSRSAAAELSTLYAAYFDLHAALADDDLTRTNMALSEIRAAVGNVDASVFSGDMRATWMNAAAVLSGGMAAGHPVKDIADARNAMRVISSVMISLEIRIGHTENDAHYILHCPMANNNAGADWMQTSDTVRNPYLGAAMSTCGTITRKIPARTGGGNR